MRFFVDESGAFTSGKPVWSLVAAIGIAGHVLWWLRPTNFGAAYVDRGRNASECVP